MDENLEKQIEEALQERADINKSIAERDKKDKRIISQYCASNNEPDVINTLQLLEKHSGMPRHDEETVKQFRQCYPKELTLELIKEFEDIKNIYQQYLENGDENS